MTLSRRMPKPAPCFTKMPSSSGPRCTMAWHMRWMVCCSTPPGDALTIPAIPHMRLAFQFHWGDFTAGAGHRNCAHWLQAIVPVFPRIALAPVTRREDDVGHLTGGNKMDRFVPLVRSCD